MCCSQAWIRTLKNFFLTEKRSKLIKNALESLRSSLGKNKQPAGQTSFRLCRSIPIKNVFNNCRLFSKWLKAIIGNNTSSKFTIKSSQVVITDNRSVYTSEKFAFFIKRSRMEYIRSEPYHSAINGFAERAVRTFNWIPCSIVAITGPVSYQVSIE